MPRSEHVYVPFNSRPTSGKSYFAIGGCHWSPEGARNFMGDKKTWEACRRNGWKIVRCKLVPVRTGKRSAT